jgi:hypothetical protein
VTIRVGIAGTLARYNLRNSAEIIGLLQAFAEQRHET